MKIDHIGYAVRRLDRAMSSLKELGYGFESVIHDTDRNVMLIFGEKDGYRIELVSPLDKGLSSPVDQFLHNAVGTPYHICYTSDDFDEEVRTLKDKGFIEVIPPKPAIAFGGRRVVFLTNLGFGLLEIVESI